MSRLVHIAAMAWGARNLISTQDRLGAALIDSYDAVFRVNKSSYKQKIQCILRAGRRSR